MTDMIEKVARAMAENAGFCWEHCHQPQWRSDARAGIAAMREPTFDPEQVNYSEGMTRTDWWRSMIDAVLTRG